MFWSHYFALKENAFDSVEILDYIYGNPNDQKGHLKHWLSQYQFSEVIF